MNQRHVTALQRTLTGMPSRRDVLRGLAAAGIGLGTARLPLLVEAQNAYGCVDVGKHCRGRDSVCCSGRCKGKRPQPGHKDRSRCVAHDASTCLTGDREAICGGTGEPVLCTTSTDFAGVCSTTTGKAAYCQASAICHPCATDRDCRQICGERAACLSCSGCTKEGGTMCASTDDLGCPAIM